MGFGIKQTNNNNKPTASIPTVIGNNPAVTPATEVVIETPDEKLAKKKYVADTFHNQTGVNTGRFADIINDLKGFADGSTIKVTYYKEHYSETDIKGRTHTNETMHNAHKSVLKIFDFEMKLTGPLQYEHDTQEVFNKLSGEAFTYPGFQPEQGDRFIYEIEQGVYAGFDIVDPPVRTSIRASTYFKITFSFVEYITEELAAKFDEGVVDVAYFDKIRFLNEPGALLTHDEVVEMRYLEKQRAKMIAYYRQKFLDDRIMYSFIRPDSVYDPYVTDFLIRILTFGEMGSIPSQLYRDAPFMNESIWVALQDPNVPLECVPVMSALTKHVLGSKSVLANSLINKKYIKWVEGKTLSEYFEELVNTSSSSTLSTASGEIPADPSIPQLAADASDDTLGDLLLHIHPHYTECPLTSDAEESGSSSGTTEWIGYILGSDDHFKLMYEFLTTRKVNDLTKLHTLIEGIWKSTKIEQFYRMPIYIYIANVVIAYIHHSEGIFQP